MAALEDLVYARPGVAAGPGVQGGKLKLDGCTLPRCSRGKLGGNRANNWRDSEAQSNLRTKVGAEIWIWGRV